MFVVSFCVCCATVCILGASVRLCHDCFPSRIFLWCKEKKKKRAVGTNGIADGGLKLGPESIGGDIRVKNNPAVVMSS